MPLLGGLLVNLFSGVVAWLTQWLTRKVAFGVTAVAASSALTLGLFVVMRGTLATVLSMTSGTPQMFAQAMAMAMPPVAAPCVSAYVTVWTACTVYVWQRDQLRLFATAG
jgi:hypothetical protein